MAGIITCFRRSKLHQPRIRGTQTVKPWIQVHIKLRGISLPPPSRSDDLVSLGLRVHKGETCFFVGRINMASCIADRPHLTGLEPTKPNRAKNSSELSNHIAILSWRLTGFQLRNMGAWVAKKYLRKPVRRADRREYPPSLPREDVFSRAFLLFGYLFRITTPSLSQGNISDITHMQYNGLDKMASSEAHANAAQHEDMAERRRWHDPKLSPRSWFVGLPQSSSVRVLRYMVLSTDVEDSHEEWRSNLDLNLNKAIPRQFPYVPSSLLGQSIVPEINISQMKMSWGSFQTIRSDL